MSKGTYNIQNRRRQSIDDTSWKTCICAFLVFITICLLFLLIFWDLKYTEKEIELESDSNSLHGDVEQFATDHSEIYEKIEVFQDHSIFTTDKLVEKYPSSDRSEYLSATSNYRDFDSNNSPGGILESSTLQLDEDITNKVIDLTEKNFGEHSSIQSVDEKFDSSSERYYTKDVIITTDNYNDSHITPKYVKSDGEMSTSEAYSTDSTLFDATTDSDYSSETHKDSFSEPYPYKKLVLETSTDNTFVEFESTTSFNDSEISTTEDSAITNSESAITTDESLTTTDESAITTDKSLTTTDESAFSTTAKNIPPRLHDDSISKKNKSSTSSSLIGTEDTCHSIVCKDEASNMLSLINRKENACDDFYKYSCHGMLNPQVAEIDLETDVWRRLEDGLHKIDSNSSVYLKNYKAYYDSCVNYDPVTDPSTKENFKQQISYLASFYDKTADIIPPTCQIITDLLRRNFVTFFDMKLDITKKGRKMGLAIVPSTFDSLLRTFMGDDSYVEKCMLQNKPKTSTIDLDDLYDKYKRCTYDMDSLLKTTKAALLYADAFSDSANQIEHINETLDMLRNHIIPILQKYAPHPSEVKTDVETNNFESIYVNDLKDRADKFINFELVFTSVFGNDIVDDDTEIQFYFWENFENIFKNIPFSEMRKVHNAIFAIYIQSVFRDFVLMRNKPFDRHKICLKSATELLPDITTQIYMKSFDEKEIESSNQFVKGIFAKINSPLEAELRNGDSLVGRDYEEALKIMNEMTVYTVDTYKPWENDRFLIDRSINVTLTGDFINDTFHLQQEYRKLLYSQYSQSVMYPNIMWTYIKTPYDTNINVIKNINTIVIPMGAIQHYKANDEIPNYLIMADIGFKLVKEIVIQLEMKNIQVFVEERETESQNFIIGDLMESQYLNFKLNKSHLFSKDIISDSAAAKLIHNIVQRQKIDPPLLWLNKSWKELYFIHLSQNFCTKRTFLDTWINMYEKNILHPIIKVNTIAMNSDEFAKTFDCKKKIMEGSITLKNSELEDTESTPDT